MTLQVAIKVSADSAGVAHGLAPAEAAFGSFDAKVRASGAATSLWAAEAQRSASAANALRDSQAGIAATIAAVTRAAALLGVTLSAGKIIEYADAWKSVESRLKLVTVNAAELHAVQEQLFDVAQRTNQSYGATSETFARFARATQGLGTSSAEILRVVETINQAVAISGGSAASAEAALFQLGQAMASGALRGDELNSVMEQTPKLAEAIAAGMGRSTGELRALAEQGRLTSDAVLKALLNQGAAVGREFGQITPTVASAFVKLENAVQKYVGEADAATGATRFLAAEINTLAEHLPAAVKGVEGLGIVAAGLIAARSWGPWVTGATQAAAASAQAAGAAKVLAAETVTAAQATAQAAARRVADVAATQAHVAGLTKEVAAQREAATARMELTRGMIEATGRSGPYNKALEERNNQTRALISYQRLERDLTRDATVAAAAKAAADAALAQAQGNHAAAIARTSLAARAAAAAQTAWNAALAFVGGWVGVAVLGAAAAIAYLATRTSEAERAQAAYNTVVREGRDRLNELAGASRGRANQIMEEQRQAVAATAAEVQAIRARIAALRDEKAALEDLQKNSGLPGITEGPSQALQQADRELAEAVRRAQAAEAALDALRSVTQTTGDAIGAELAGATGRGSRGLSTLTNALTDAQKAAGVTIERGKLLTEEQAELAKHTATLTAVIDAGVGAWAKYRMTAEQAATVLEAIRGKLDPVRAAIAGMNREIALMQVPDGAARAALAVLQQLNAERAKVPGMAPLTTLSPEYLEQLTKARELETARVKAATDARAKVMDLETRITKAQASGNEALVARLTRDKAVEEMVARGVDRTVAEANAQQDYTIAITAAGAAAGEAGQGFLRAADAQTRLAQAAGLGEAAARQAAAANKLAEEAAKGNGNAAAQLAANQREEAAAILTIRNETVRGLELETANTNRLTEAMAAGGEAVRVAQEEEYRLNLIRKLGTDATVAGTAAQQALNDAMDAYRRNRAANDNNRLAQERQAANDNLALARREIDLMGQAESVRSRALTSLQLQQEAARKVAELGEDGARQWLAWQEQIADARAYTDFLKEVQAAAKEISGDISEALYDRLMDPSKATSVVDVFKAIFRRIAIAALEANIVLPIVTQVVGAAPALFGITSPSASGQAGAAQGSGITGTLANTATSAALSKAGSWAVDKVVPGGLMGSIDAWAYSNLGIGSATYGAPVVASNGMLTGGGATSLATPTGITGGLSAYLGAAGAGALGGGLLGGWAGTAANSKAVGAGVGALAGAGSAYLASVVGLSSLGGPVGLAIGAVVGAIMGALGTAKKGAGPGAAIDYLYGADGAVSSQTYTRKGETDERVTAISETTKSTLDLLRQAGGNLIGPISWHYGYNERDGVGATLNDRPLTDSSDPDYFVRAVVAQLLKEGSLTFGADAALTEKALNGALANGGNKLEDVVNAVALAKSITDATAGLAGLDKTFDALTASARKAAAAQYETAASELEVAKKAGIEGEYRALLEKQLRAAFDPAAATTQTVSATGAALASLNGDMQALSEAVKTLGLSISDAELQAWHATKVADMQKQYSDGLTAQINTARGKDYLNQAGTVAATLKAVRQEISDLYANVPGERDAHWATAVEINRLSAQKVIDENALTGTGYQEFIKNFVDALKGIGVAASDITQLTAGLHESVEANNTRIKAQQDLYARVLEAQVAAGQASQGELDEYVQRNARNWEIAAAAGDATTLMLLDRLYAAQDTAKAKAAAAAATSALDERWQSATAGTRATGVAGLHTSLVAASAQYTADSAIDGAKALDILRASVTALVADLSDSDVAVAETLRWSSAVSGTAAQALADALAVRQAATQETVRTARETEAAEVLASRVTSARSAYLDALSREQQTLRDTASRLREVGASLSALRASLALDSALSPLSAQARLAEAKRQLQVAVDEFRATGHADVAARAQQLMQDYLQTSREYNSSAPAYEADYDWVVGLTSELESLATTTASAKDAQAAALDATVAALGGTTSAVLSLTDALARYTEALRLSGGGVGAQDFGDSTVASDNRVVAAATVQSGNGYTGAFRDGQFAAWAQSTYAAHDADQGVSTSVNAMLRASTGYTGDFRDGAFLDYVRSGAVTELQREAARSILRRNNVVPAFASGGWHTGGLRLVGEYGAELEATGASRIYSHQQTRDLLAPRPAPDLTPLIAAVGGSAVTISRAVTASGEATVLAIGRLTSEVAGMRAELADSQRQIRDLTRIVARLAA